MEIIKCKKCGCEMGASSERCPVCGTPVSNNSEDLPANVENNIITDSEEIEKKADSEGVISNDLVKSDKPTSNITIDSGYGYNSHYKLLSVFGGILFLIICVFIISKSCKGNDNSSNTIQGVYEEDSVIVGDELLLERAHEIFKRIPDHGDSSDLDPTIYSKSFYELLKIAFHAADEWNSEGDLSGDAMFYWYIGQDGSEEDGLLGISLTSKTENVAKFKVTYKNCGITDHQMKLIKENGQWVLDDWDNKRDEAKDIIDSYNNYIATNEKQVKQYVNILINNGKREYYTCEYFLYDISCDGIPELWMIVGTCEADTKIMVYTIKKDQAVLIFDQSACNTSFYLGKNYVNMVYAHMGYERWNKLTYGTYMNVETIYENNDVGSSDDYRTVPEREAELHSYNDENAIREAFKGKKMDI